MSTKKENVQPSSLERLFEDFYGAASGTFEAFERLYGVKGLCAQVFGDSEDDEGAKATFRRSSAWDTLAKLYDYAANGVEPADMDTQTLVLMAADIVTLASSEAYFPDQEWTALITLGDARYALDEGSPLSLGQLALLANVDIRTVRNAASSGELLTFKTAPGSDPYADNASARRWLHGRRGFKPTVLAESTQGLHLEGVTTPTEFGRFLAEQRARLSDVETARAVEHPSVTPAALAQLEAGIFALPLDAVFPVADYHRLDRKPFLQCVMRVFFSDELRVLTDAAGQND